MAQSVTLGGRLKLSVEGRNTGGRPGRFTGAVTWSAVPPVHVVLTPSADGLTCAVQAALPGECVVTASVPGLNAGTFAISVLAADATDLVIVGEVVKA